MIEELQNIDTSLVDKVMKQSFNGGRYFLQNSDWRYAFDKALKLDPVGIVEASVEAIPKPFFICHISGRSTLHILDVVELHKWCLHSGGFYPVFVWRALAAFGVGRQLTESYILVPKETDAVVLQAHLSA